MVLVDMYNHDFCLKRADRIIFRIFFMLIQFNAGAGFRALTEFNSELLVIKFGNDVHLVIFAARIEKKG